MTNFATSAAETGGPHRPRGGRVGWLVAGGIAAAVLVVIALLASSGRGPAAGASPSAPPSVPPATSGAADVCAPASLSATVGRWEGATGQRIGRLTVTNTAATACTLPATIRASLIDRNGGELIVGEPASLGAVTVAAGGSVETLVQTGNYCGPAAQEPAAVALAFEGWRVVARPAEGDISSGVPPCMGETDPAKITIQPWGTPQG